MAFDFGLNYPYLTSTSGSFAGYTTDDYSLYLEGTVCSILPFCLFFLLIFTYGASFKD